MEDVGRKLTGMRGVLGTGEGEQAIHPHETLEILPEGIYVYHHDLYETFSFFPIFTLRMARLHNADKERLGPNKSWHERGGWDARKPDGAGVAEVARKGELGP